MIPAGLDLSGSVIVLTHARTGSSLVMQTLGLLGADIVGDFERPDLPAAGNPKGYFEHRGVLRDGLYAPELAERPDMLSGSAVKIALRKLVERSAPEEWERLAQPHVRLLLPVRSPAESLLSRASLSKTGEGFADRPPAFHQWARHQLNDLAVVARWVCASQDRRSPPVCIDYRSATADPAAYVQRLAASAGLHPSAGQVAAAVANIDSALYRYRREERDDVRETARRVRPLEQVYELLRSDAADKWAQVRANLAAWGHQGAP